LTISQLFQGSSDLSGIAGSAFVPIALSGVRLTVLAPAINHVRR
jgi:hypothetical protein